MLTNTQKGAAGEQFVAACVTLSSGGELELFKPVVDDDHTDITVGVRGRVPALAIQVKTALKLDRQGFAVARMSFPEGAPREHPAFVYVIGYVVDIAIDTTWVVPSTDFNRLSYRGAGRRSKGIELQFMASPTRADKWAPFRGTRFELGPRLMDIIGSLPRGGHPPVLTGAHLLTIRTNV